MLNLIQITRDLVSASTDGMITKKQIPLPADSEISHAPYVC